MYESRVLVSAPGLWSHWTVIFVSCKIADNCQMSGVKKHAQRKQVSLCMLPEDLGEELFSYKWIQAQRVNSAGVCSLEENILYPPYWGSHVWLWCHRLLLLVISSTLYCYPDPLSSHFGILTVLWTLILQRHFKGLNVTNEEEESGW